ncbi:hypothetical protein [Anabaena cylindrica]|uniref:hypothetical protein n=1 Tax=Anabaena cylindrica TaxID=1165 RepID=UPI002B202C4C|nr:hypothetical protein [Anabaena cylindrica]
MIVSAFAAAPALADNCGTSDRVALPKCVSASQGINGRVTYWDVRNRCSHPVTLKFDARSAPDKRETIDAGGGLMRFEVPYYSGPSIDFEGVKVSCCPQYNSCSNE